MTTKTLKLGRQYRLGTLEQREDTAQSRKVDLTFSSEEPVERWFGVEILGHKRAECDLDFLASGSAPFLMDHSTRDQRGVVESARLVDKRGVATVRLSKSERGEELLGDVLDGIRPNVSVAYEVNELQLTGTEKDMDTFRVTKWRPLEISSVAIPADPTVGVGRAAEGPELESRDVPIISTDEEKESNTMAKEATVSPAAAAAAAGPDEAAIRSAAAAEAADKTRKEESKRTGDILAIGKRFDMMDQAIKAIGEAMPVDAFRAQVLDAQAEKAAGGGSPDSLIGLEAQEAKRYSLLRAIRAHVEKDWTGAGLERECSREIAKKLGRDPNGFFVPYDVLLLPLDAAGAARTRRDLGSSPDTAGGHLIGTDHLAADFIGMLRNRMWVVRLGARLLSGLVGNVDIPKQTGAGALEWMAEGDSLTGADQVFGNVTMSPKQAGARTKMTRRLLLQSSPDVENLVRDDLNQVVAIGLDSASINGTGLNNQPTGVRNQNGVGSVAHGIDGDVPTWPSVVEFETDVSAGNADLGALGYLTNSQVRGKLKTTEKAASTAQFIWDITSSEPGMGELNGYRAAVSNQVPNDLTKGTGTALSSMIFGNWNDLLIGNWGTMDVQADPYSAGDEGALIVRVFQDIDIAVRHPESFSVSDDIVTA